METIDKINVCIDYIKRFFEDSKGEKAIIGISGGKDSTVAAALCVEALGKENVFVAFIGIAFAINLFVPLFLRKQSKRAIN